ncbi:MAG: TonB-dependent receptor [Chlamydiae bacterium]|nr:TonB-dependent receptor [Chlamydiota bacterium]
MKGRHFFKSSLALILSLGFYLPSWGDEVQKTEPVIVTATKLETPVSHVTQSYSVVDSGEISDRHEEMVEESLRNVPGVFVVRNGTQGANATTFLRGATSAQTLVLMDGVEVNAPTVGSFDFGHLRVDHVDRIEIVRGIQSALYGSEAMGGVIHIITKKGEGRPRLFFEGEGGMDETARGFAGFSGKKGRVDLSSTYSYLTTEGEFDNDAYENFQWTGNAGVDVSDQLRLDLISRVGRAEKEIQDFGITIPDPNRSLETDSEWVALKIDHWLTSGWEHQLTLSFNHEFLKDRDPLNPDEVGVETLSRITNEMSTVEWQHNFFWGDLQTLTAGFEYQDLFGKNTTTGNAFGSDYPFEEDPNNFAFYFQDQFNFWDRVFIVPGVRYDENSIFGGEVSPKVSGAFWIFPQTKLKASWGEGFRSPSVNELVFPDYGNPDLKPEESQGWEAGFEQTFLKEKVGIDFAYFQTDYDDLIDSEVISLDPFVSRANNISEASIDGLELSGFVKPWECLTLKGSWTHLDAENDVTGEPLIRRPDDSGSVGAILKWQEWTLSTDATFVGSRPDFDKELEGYVKLDVAVSYQVNEHWAPYVRVENLLDDDYEEASGFPAPGILVFGGVRGEF